MSNSISLIDELKKGGYDSCLMTSYSINFAFYEEYLLRKMQTAGVTNHLLFVDRKMCAAAIQSFAPKLAGSLYGLVPMYCNQAFHPKVYMLLGKKKGLLIVGSHNITLSGFGSNLEVTNVVRFDEKSNDKDLAAFKEAFHAFEVWLNDFGQNSPQIVRDMLGKAKGMAPWLRKKPKHPSSKSFMFSSYSNKECLWNALLKHLPPSVDKTFGVSAFFDSAGVFLSTLSEISVAKPTIAIQPHSVCLNHEILSRDTVRFVDIKLVQPGDVSKSVTYAHAKALAFLSEQDSFFVSGSANFSSNAWLKTGGSSNAEAVLLLQGEDATLALDSTNLLDTERAEQVLEINSIDQPENSKGAKQFELFFAELSANQSITIELKDHLKGSEPFYKDELGSYYQIKHTLSDSALNISEKSLEPGRLIYLRLGSEVVATVITLNINSLEKLCESSDERQLRQAISSINSDYPQFNLLFNCIDKLTPQLRRSVTASAKGKQQSSEETIDRESLITSINQEANTHTKSGRRSISSDGLDLILDMFLYALPSIQSESNALYREDNLGRNEEELVGTDDEDATTNLAITLEQAEYVHKRLSRILNKLENVLSSDLGNEEGTANNMSFLLMAFVVVHSLSQHEFINHSKLEIKQTNHHDRKPTNVNSQPKPIIEQKHLQKLGDIAFCHFFSEKKSPVQIPSDKESIFNSDEYTQLLAHLAWLLYKLDIHYSDSAPLSRSVKECENINRSNARILFLMQRLDGDAEAYKIAENLLEAESQEALAWLYRAVSTTELLLYEDIAPYRGYQLAKSNRNGFNGFCFIDKERNNNSSVTLSTVGKSLTFDRKSLDIAF